MADIFISHSGQDNEAAAAIGERIRRERPTWSLFYDKDNIRAGQRWQERLREELQSCRVVLALLSRNWLGSPWCFTEAVTATFRGKDVVGIETEDLTADDLARAPPILHERQRVRLRDGDDRPWQEILEALDRSGLDPNDWFPIPPNVGPYPGLVAFDEKDAGVFFGRKQEITEYLGILDTAARPGPLAAAGHLGRLGQRQVLAAARRPDPAPAPEARVGRDQPVRGRPRARAQPAGPAGRGARQPRHIRRRGSTSPSHRTTQRRSPRFWMRRCGGWSRPPAPGCSCRWIRRKLW